MLIPLRDNLNFKGTPWLTLLLIAINVVMFAYWEGGSQVSVEKVVLYSAIPYEITHPGMQCVPNGASGYRCDDEKTIENESGIEFPHTGVTVITSMFMHGSWMHLIGNMIFLFAFGVALELALGPVAFLLFYLAGGFGAEFGYTLFDMSSPVPSLGASGAISAVMAGYVMLFPAGKLRTLVWPLPPILVWIRANWLIGVLMLLQILEAYFVLSSAYGTNGGGVAYFAHFGGFLTGVALIKLVTDKAFVDQQRLHAQLCSGDVMLVRQEHVEEPAQPAAPGPPDPFVPPAVPSAYADPFAVPPAPPSAPAGQVYRPST